MSGSAMVSSVRDLRRLLDAQRSREESDAHLLHAFADRHDDSAFTTLLRRHGPMVLGVCRRVLGHEQDAEDAFQATFLVLARRAAALREPTALASFLYGTAYHLACKVKRTAGRRRKYEGRVRPAERDDCGNPADELSWREVRALLDEEIARLSEPHRSVFILCCLEGLSQAEAGRQLGLKERTVSNRLAEARRRLGQRLARRGVELTAVLAAATLATTPASALPPALLGRTSRAALATVAAGAVPDSASVVSPAVAALANNGPSIVSGAKVPLAIALLLAATVLAGAGALVHFRPAAAESGAPAAAEKAQPAQPAARDEDRQTVTVAGRVVDPDGKPFVGAKVFFARSVLAHRDTAPPPPAVTSDAEGRFRLRVSRTGYQIGNDYEKDHWMQGVVVAVGGGFGHGWVGGDIAAKLANVTVKLARIVPIEGRVVDLQGKPIAGVRVQVRGVGFREDGGDLKAFVESLRTKKDWPNGPSAPGMWLEPARLGLTRPIVTGAGGTFRVKGISAECLATLRFEGPTIETAEVLALTRPAPTIVMPRGDNRPEMGNVVYHGNTFDHAAAPTRPVVGVVRDRDTGKPIAGVTIRAHMGSAREHFASDPYLETTTDEAGRYRFVGLPRQGGHRLEAVPGRAGPYLPAAKTSPARPGLEPVTLDFTLKRGVLIRGRVTNKETGRPVRAVVRYGAFADNPYLKEAPGFRDSDSDFAEVRTAADGSFTLLALPGPGLLAVKAADREEEGRFLTGVGADDIHGPRFGDSFDTVPSGCDPGQFNALAAVNPAPDARHIERNLVLDPGKTVTGKIVDPEGKPVKGASIDSVRSVWVHVDNLPTAEFRFTGVDPKHPRWYFVRHRGRNLGTVVLIKGDEAKPLTIRLQKCAVITGRVVDDDGLPRTAYVMGYVHRGQLGARETQHGLDLHRTGKDGRFRMECVIPGLKIGLLAGKNATYFDTLVPELTLKAGEVKELGDVKARPSE